MPSPDAPSAPLCDEDRKTLLLLAEQSIRYGLRHHRPLPVDAGAYPLPLQQQRASFVTLLKQRQLRGCIGHLEANQPTVVDVASNAYSAAFEDPRFPALSEAELPLLEIHISLLTPARPLEFDSEEALIGMLRPGEDGLILEEETHRGTFLPSVWRQLPDPREFIRQLKLKAGLPAGYWSDKIRISRYTTESFP